MPLPRLFIGNFDFEHRLADPQRVLPRRIEELNADLAWSWLALAQDGDLIWTPRMADLETIARSGILQSASVRMVADWRDVETIVEPVPWGWTDELLLTARVKRWHHPNIDPNIVKWANSRRTSAEMETQWNVGLPDAKPCRSLDEITTAIAALPSPPRWVVKAEFGMSGRERQVGQGTLSTPAVNWIKRRLANDGVAFFEPWVERLDEVGILFGVPTDGEPQLVGVAPMLIAPGGHYRGSWFAPLPNPSPWWIDAVDVASRAAKELQSGGYIGPLGIDAMLYRLPDGNTAVRPLQDINARWTMGRLAWSWRSRFSGTTCGYWWHGPKTAFESGEHLTAWPLAESPEVRVTTPRDVEHVAVLVWK
jgi:hypothetical protein